MYLTVVAAPADELAKIEDLEYTINQAGLVLLAKVDEIKASALGLAMQAKELYSAVFIADILPFGPCRYNPSIENSQLFALLRLFRTCMSRNISIAAARGENINRLTQNLLSAAKQREIHAFARDASIKYNTTDNVIKVIGSFGFKKIELIERSNKKYIKKTYTEQKIAYLRREIECRQALAHIPEISPLIDSGQYHFIIPYYDHINLSENLYKPFPVARARIAIAAIEKMWDSGYAMLDSNPGNFLYLADNTVKIIDFECAVKHNQPDVPFSESFFFSHQRSDLSALLDAGEMKGPHYSWHNTWYPLTGVKYQDLYKEKGGISLFNLKKFICSYPRLLARHARIRKRIYNRRGVYSDAGWHYFKIGRRYFF